MKDPARTSAEWIAYFRANAADLFEVPWELGADITADDPNRYCWPRGGSPVTLSQYGVVSRFGE